MMVETFDSRTRQMNSQAALGCSNTKTSLGPIQLFCESVRSGLKALRIYAVFCLLVLLLPLFLAITKDWICILVVFQAFASAVRLQNSPASRPLSTCSSTSLSPSAIEGEYRALQ